ncbi:hypothetical protein BB560_002419 [Smittium megazygosporum]|uniref:Uncharacterized protein n=1 Tax=Smittium megazygosporum TaxID=133381 RepID=A0A2T9ZEU5_9FUNG|nr:hypothetical protein BB560_002419 [Smittium megazygosporum]
MQYDYYAPPTFTEWESYSLDFDSFHDLLYPRTSLKVHSPESTRNFINLLSKQLETLEIFISKTLSDIWQRIHLCETLLSTFLELDSSGKDIATGEIMEHAEISIGLVSELYKFNQENFSMLCKLAIEYQFKTGTDIFPNVRHLLFENPFNQHVHEQKEIVTRFEKIFQIINKFSDGNDTFLQIQELLNADPLQTITGWINPTEIEDILDLLSRNLEVSDYFDNDLDTFFESSRLDPSLSNNETLGIDRPFSLDNHTLSSTLCSDKIIQKSPTPTLCRTFYFDYKLKNYHGIASRANPIECVKMKIVNNTSDLETISQIKPNKRLEPQDQSRLSPADSEYKTLNMRKSRFRYKTYTNNKVYFELDSYNEIWSDEKYNIQKVEVPTKEINSFLNGEYNRNNIHQNPGNCANHQKCICSESRKIFQKIQKKIIIEKLQPEVAADLEISDIKNGSACFKDIEIDEILGKDCFSSFEMKFQAKQPLLIPATIKIIVKGRNIPLWLDTLLYRNKNYFNLPESLLQNGSKNGKLSEGALDTHQSEEEEVKYSHNNTFKPHILDSLATFIKPPINFQRKELNFAYRSHSLGFQLLNKLEQGCSDVLSNNCTENKLVSLRNDNILKKQLKKPFPDFLSRTKSFPVINSNIPLATPYMNTELRNQKNFKVAANHINEGSSLINNCNQGSSDINTYQGFVQEPRKNKYSITGVFWFITLIVLLMASFTKSPIQYATVRYLFWAGNVLYQLLLVYQSDCVDCFTSKI